MRDVIDGLSDVDKAAVLAAMKEVRAKGLTAARQLEGEIYEVRASGDRAIYRVLFAPEGEHDQVFLALQGINKKQQKTPKAAIDLAQRRLREWRRRSRAATGKVAGDRGKRPSDPDTP